MKLSKKDRRKLVTNITTAQDMIDMLQAHPALPRFYEDLEAIYTLLTRIGTKIGGKHG